MKSNYSITIDHKNRLINHKHYGLIERKQLGQAWMEIIKMTEFLKHEYGLLSDYREGSFNFSIDNIDPIWDFLNANANLLKGKIEAVLVDNPKDTVIPVLFQNSIYERIGFAVKIFSTQEAAKEWLKANDTIMQ
ncbi:MAG: hypothetical protein R6U85_00645 [Salinivirgaceae bacterium]